MVKKALAGLLLVLAIVPAAGWADPAGVWRREKCSLCNGTGKRFWRGKWCYCPRCDGKGWVMKFHRWHRSPYDSREWKDNLGDQIKYDVEHCFVATAAYGSAWEPQVAALRRFRDQCLLQSPVGQGFVALYYAVSPPLADAICSRPWARALTRAALTPAVVIARAFTGDIAAVALVLGVGGVGLALPRLRRALKRRGRALAG